MNEESVLYKPFTLKAALELTSPPSWVASIGPCVIAGALAVCCALLHATTSSDAEAGAFAQMAVVLDFRSVLCWGFMMACAILLQSAVNTMNDYEDFKSGLDTAETILDETDASIVYNQINPKHALMFAMALLAQASVLGICVVLLSSPVLIIWAIIAAAAIGLYSSGPKPISSLPLGEVVSGTVLGGILMCVTFYAMTVSFSPIVLLLAAVPTVSIAQIMLTNNTCDIERDIVAGRRTLPGIIGEQRSAVINAVMSFVAFALFAVVLVWAGLYIGLVVLAVGLTLCFPKIRTLLKGPYNLENRRVMMGTVITYNKWLANTIVFALLLGGVAHALI